MGSNDGNVDRGMVEQLLLSKSNLPKQTIMQIWDVVNTSQDRVTRNELYQALALTALAQQGKPPSVRLLEMCSGQEAPKPTLGDLSDLRASSSALSRHKSVDPHTVHYYSYKDLRGIDFIKVELVPKKKGIILKHVEYEVTSQRARVTVMRRYSDFVALHELLSTRFPYRVIPRLPPKRVGASKEFIELRQKCLQRYMNIICRNPHICYDKLFMFFLTFSGKDIKHKLRDCFRNIPDEFMTSNVGSNISVPMDAQYQLSNSKEHIMLVYESIVVFKAIAEQMACRWYNFSSDMLQMNQQFSTLSNDTRALTSWTTGSSQSWPRLQSGFKHLTVDFASLADKSRLAAADEEHSIVEKLSFFQDLLTAYKDLCDRHERGLTNDHLKTLQKIEMYKKKRTLGATRNSEADALDEMEQKVLEQEDQIISMEKRNLYSLYCLQLETQFVHAHLSIFYEYVACMAGIEDNLTSELSRIWNFMAPTIAGLSSVSSPDQPSTTRYASQESHFSPARSPMLNIPQRSPFNQPRSPSPRYTSDESPFNQSKSPSPRYTSDESPFNQSKSPSPRYTSDESPFTQSRSPNTLHIPQGPPFNQPKSPTPFYTADESYFSPPRSSATRQITEESPFA